MQKIAISGAGGHIGFNVAKKLLEKKYAVLVLYRTINTNIVELKNWGATLHYCNLLNEETYTENIKDTDVFFHLAAENTTSMQHEDRTIENTNGITKAVLNACLKAGIKKIIYTSSVVVLGRSHNKNSLIDENNVVAQPESPYVKGKLLAEQYVKDFAAQHQLDIRHIYPSWVVGTGDCKLTPPHKVIKDFIEKGQPFYFEGGISIVDVEALADAEIAAMEIGSTNEKYIVAGENITFKEFYTILSEFTQKPKPKIKLPKWFIYLGAKILDSILSILGKSSPVSPQYVQSVVGNYSWYNSQKAQQCLGYKIVPVREILRKAIQEGYKRTTNTINLGKKTNFLPDITEENNEGTLLVTGVPGWLGNRMIDILINGDRFGNFRTNRKIKILVEPRFKGLLHLPSNYEMVYADITNKNQLHDAVKNVETVFHLAGAIYPKNVEVLYKVNEQGTKNLVDVCIEKNVKRFIYMSTDSTCGHSSKKQPIFDENTIAKPYKHYGKSKLLAETYLLQKSKEGKINATSLRGFWFFGPFMPERNLAFANMFFWPRQIVFGNGKNVRSISHIDNIITAFLMAENNPNTFHNWYWIGNDAPHPTVDEIYQTIAKALGVPYKPLYIPKILCRCFELADTILNQFNYIHATLQSAGKFDYNIAGNIDKAKKDFGYQPRITLEDTAKELQQMVNRN